ncbi:sodium-coupled monocarboxylate transporter 1-like [Brachionus plicatilis]|uniref:Sodium-coupled monocarboxylate transporter 1-like n=1 Tax=Brachionus plicatilis TaxID=10195 RepID=A0A3M7PN13_BRAPC|nr:sodium-coupled monocarboxylate transporter 1-like [Brachionus plicatilis]
MKTKFDFYDYFIFILILLITILIGLFFGFHLNEKLKVLWSRYFKKNEIHTEQTGGSKTMEYLTANKSMSAFPIALSLLSTFFSSSSLLGFPAEVYQYGIQYWMAVIGVSFAPLVGAFLTGPFFENLKIVSVFEYLKMRYKSEYARLLGVTLYLIRTLIAMGIVIYGPATALSSVTDISSEVSILLIGLIATFYTTIGGIKAVIWTDVFQTTIMFAGVIAVIVKGTVDVGGLSNLWEINSQGERLNFFVLDPNPLIRQSFWSLVIGSFVAWISSYGIDQQMVQRYAAAKNRRTAQAAILLNIPGVIILISLCCFTGLVLFANFSGCDPLSDKTNNVKNPNQLVPFFVMQKFSNIIFIPGLFLSSIFCASLSSVSSALNSMSACIWRDYLMRIKYFYDFDDTKSSRTTKIIALVCGFICTGMGFLISTLGTNLAQISGTINGSLQAPIIGIFFLSCLFPFNNIYGLFAGALSGFSIGCWLSLGSFLTKPNYPKPPVSIQNCTDSFLRSHSQATNLEGFNQIYSVSYMWLSPIGVFFTIVIVDDKLIIYRAFRKKTVLTLKK